MARIWKRSLCSCLIIALMIAAPAVLVCNGIIIPNDLFRSDYPVRGVDVSNWQGDIDWDTLAAQDISFAFIKATEGSSFVDQRFAFNWEQAGNTGLRIGAYHFFSYDSPGTTQAENFIRNVPRREGMLPPMIDVEFYGGNAHNPPPRDTVQPELDAMIDALTAHYGTSPILYATRKSYDLYLRGAYDNCDIWIRSVFTPPVLLRDRSWTFWQYTDRARLPGYSGAEEYIDMNVFFSTEEVFSRYGT